MIIGIGNKARRGKDTAAAALVRDAGFVRIGFADALKELALTIDPVIVADGAMNVAVGRGRLSYLVRQTSWDEVKDRHPEARQFLQNLGEGVRQVLGDDTWVKLVLDQVGDRDVVIPDVRYPNEAAAIKALGGTVVQINRVPPANIRAHATHESEIALDNYEFDHVIDNNGTIVDLEEAIKSLVADLKKPAAKKAAAEKPAA